MRLAVIDDYHRRAHEFADWDSLAADVRFFHEPIPREQLATTLAEFDALVLMRERTAFPREVLEGLPKLRLLVTTGMRNASVDVPYLHERGVVVCGTEMPAPGGGYSPGGPVDPGDANGLPSTVEVAWALILAVCKRVTWEDRALRQGSWQLGMPVNLAGLTLGLLGLGRLGGAMVAPARVFGMDVIAWSSNLTVDRASAAGAEYVTKDELLARSDVLSVHLVLSKRSRGLIGERELMLMKRTAVLVNTSRGPIVDERALIAALRERRIAAAGLDVFDHEPLPPGHELLSLENTVLLPHLGYVSEDAFRWMYAQVVEDIAAYLAGAPIRLVP